MKLPIKFRLMQMIAAGGVRTTSDVLRVLQMEYSGERCVNSKTITEYLQSLRVCGLLEMDLTGEFDEFGVPVKNCRVTEYGKGRLTFIAAS